MIRTTQTVELSDEDLREAVTAWLQKKLRRKGAGEWTVTLDVNVSADGDVLTPKVSASRVMP